MARRIVVEWTRSTLRVALAEGRGAQWRIRALQSRPIGDPTEIVPALRAMLKTVKSRGARVIGVIPREQVITRVVKFPTTEREELARMVELYAAGQLPYPRSQTVMDFHAVQQQDGFSLVAIVACQREVVDGQLSILREAGLSPERLTVSSWGVLNWYRQACSPRGGSPADRPNSDQEPALVINVDDARTDLALLADGRLLSSRSIAQGAQGLGAAGDPSELLALEVERTRVAIRKELPGADARSLILTGVGDLTDWRAALSQRLDLPVTVIEGLQPLSGSVTPPADPISPVVVGGLAGGEIRDLLNLNPQEMRVQASHRRQVRELVMVSVLLVVVLALGAGGLALQGVRHRNAAARLGRVLVDVAPKAKRARERLRATQLVDGLLEERRRFALTLSGVFRATPARVTLERLTFEQSRWEVVLRGNAPSTQAVLAYVKRLEGLDGIGGVDLRYSRRRSTPAGERTDFELVLRQAEHASHEVTG